MLECHVKKQEEGLEAKRTELPCVGPAIGIAGRQIPLAQHATAGAESERDRKQDSIGTKKRKRMKRLRSN